MIRDLAKALVAVLLILVLVAEVQRADDAAVDKFQQQHSPVAHQ